MFDWTKDLGLFKKNGLVRYATFFSACTKGWSITAMLNLVKKCKQRIITIRYAENGCV